MTTLNFKFKKPYLKYLGKWHITDLGTYFFIKDLLNEDERKEDQRISYISASNFLFPVDPKKSYISSITRESMERNLFDGSYKEVSYDEVLANVKQ